MDQIFLDILLSLKIIDHTGNEKELKKEEIEFYYRGTKYS